MLPEDMGRQRLLARLLHHTEPQRLRHRRLLLVTVVKISWIIKNLNVALAIKDHLGHLAHLEDRELMERMEETGKTALLAKMVLLLNHLVRLLNSV
jgi:hypothetical protein